MQPTVVIVQRRMTEYRIPFFDKLHRHLATVGIRLQVIYGNPTSSESLRNDGAVLPWGLPIRFAYLRFGTAFLVIPTTSAEAAKGCDLLIVPHENSMVWAYLTRVLRPSCRGQVAFWGHGKNFQSTQDELLGEKVRAWTSRRVGWWFAYTERSVLHLTAEGVPSDRITCLNNATDTTEIVCWRAGLEEAEIEALRLDLGLCGENVAVYLGSLHSDKRIDFLLLAADRLHAQTQNFELLIIGDGPLRGDVRKFAASRTWCKWVGAKRGRDKVLHLHLGKVILNPGMVGLSILDSFAMRIPMVTTDCGTHSPEIAYLESGVNGIMCANEIAAFVDSVVTILSNAGLREQLAKGCEASCSRYSLESMVENFRDGVVRALGATRTPAPKNVQKATPEWHIAILWQRFLPYHVARISQLSKRCAQLGYRLTAIEVASQDSSYGFDRETAPTDFDHICCFQNSSYHDHSALEIHSKVLAALEAAAPDVVFAPATPFPEGMAAITYREQSFARTIMMDDAWTHTDRRGDIVAVVKRLIHNNIDGMFIPAPSHESYYVGLGVPKKKLIFGVDVVDNDRFADAAASEREAARRTAPPAHLIVSYFLFVGRFLPRKGIETLVSAYAEYRRATITSPWNLVLVGGGAHETAIRHIAAGVEGVYFAGAQFGSDLHRYYGLAKLLIVPSESDPWGLVINEALASGLPVIASTGCGATRSLVQVGQNGWHFSPRDTVALTQAMLAAAALPPATLAKMGEKSKQIISPWSLDRFVDGILQAMQLPRSQPSGLLSKVTSRLWKGRVSIN